MRRKARRSHWLSVLLVPLLFVAAGAGEAQKEADDGLDVYFRETNLGALADQELPVYPDDAAGESLLLGRDFPDAPPQIPHSVEDMLPITSDDNECLQCHHPDNAVSEKDAPLPETHFEQAIMAKGKPGESMVWVVSGYQKAKDVVGSRYNCDMCHTPQAKNVETPKSTFVRVE
jgi:cytochrome c-type protein NapB